VKTNLLHARVARLAGAFLLLVVLLALAGCANTVIYQHTTSVKASAKELDVEVLGVLPDVHVTDGVVEVSITTVVSLSTGSISTQVGSTKVISSGLITTGVE
jgi:hypothetical protein